ncbi:DNA alkylation repair protein [Paenibacillus pinisoli]|uniref:DNA alkylation repair protein n=1 Tax=Paenibacillus pinisoli TaxID=1276110 RepID=A0A3A6PH08_9BACL|nr:DNA alkylation repair protein [Paenibacillus pinisoli]RJX39540.1 DNA alkylation repair protein [Paenibacillus pinisoli]
MPESIAGRKGPRRASEIVPEALDLLNRGQIQTVNLTEWLAVDHIKLLRAVLVELGLQHHTAAMMSALERIEGQPAMKVIPAVAGEWLGMMRQQKDGQKEIVERLAAHTSDSVRCWAAYIIGLEALDLEQKLASIRRFAADHHFGVREIAWMAIRADVSQELLLSIQVLSEWVHEEDANLRRFAVEATRPRGVWAKHITELKVNPELGLPLLEPLKADTSKYVQDSVGNWLNDAAKSRPEWVAGLCQTWLALSGEASTKRIAARAQRSIKS